MAKKKMTLEEKLEEAIVKDAPYEVSENWVWTKVGTILKVSSGKGLTAKEMNDEGSIPVYGGNGITGYHDKAIYDTSKLIIGRVGAQCGNVHITSFPCWITDNALVVEYQKKNINEKYLYYILKELNLGSYSTSSAQPVISGGKIYKIAIPLPPLKEQQRIVDKIESLFEKLDKAKELIEEARDDFEKRKSAILEKAFRGELTKAWRSNNLVDYNSTWTKHVFSNIAKVKSNLVQPQDFLKYPHIAPDNIEKKTGKLLAYRTIEEDNVKSAKHRFYPGQIIYSKIRPYLSKVVIVDFEGLCSADMYPIETDLDTKYLYYYMLSDTFIDFASNSGSRSVLPKINQKELGKINVPVCSINEQKEIVRILDKLLEEESKIEELTTLEEQIELIKKSILAKAFRGQLGTNCEDDESALELLKEILNT